MKKEIENKIIDLVTMSGQFETPNMPELFRTAYLRGYSDGCEDTKKHITNVINASTN
jgi:hypothetical protein